MNSHHSLFLTELPAVILSQEIAKHLNGHDLGNLSLANKYTYQLLFKPTLFQRLKEGIALSATKQVKTLLTLHPDFDLDQLHAAFLTAIRSGDIDMCKVIVNERPDILKHIELPKKLVNKTDTYDFSAIINALDELSKYKIKEIQNALDKYNKELVIGKNIEIADLPQIIRIVYQVETALIQFKTNLDKIVKEKGFPFQALIDACKIFTENQSLWSEHEHLFSIHVIGYLQRLSPAWLKKAFAANIYKVIAEGKAYSDSFICLSDGPDGSLGNNGSIDPARDVPNSGLGFNYCVTISRALLTHFSGYIGWDFPHHLKTYLEGRLEEFNWFIQPHPNMQPQPHSKRKQKQKQKQKAVESNTYDFSTVVAAIDAVIAVDTKSLYAQEAEAYRALEQFHTDLNNIIKEKGEFPFQALLDACKIYDVKFHSWTEKQRELFSITVIGYLQRLSPVWLKKALATGIYNITEKNEACGDTCVLQKHDNHINLDLNDPNNSDLGSIYCVDMFGYPITRGGDSISNYGSDMVTGDCLKNYLECMGIKTEATDLSKIMQQPHQKPKEKPGKCTIA